MTGKRAAHRGDPGPHRKKPVDAVGTVSHAAVPAHPRSSRGSAVAAILTLALATVLMVVLVQISVQPSNGAGSADRERSVAARFPTVGDLGDIQAAAKSPTTPSTTPSGASGTSAPSTGRPSGSAPASGSPSAKASATGAPESVLPARPATRVSGESQRPEMLRLPDGTDVPVLAVGVTKGQLNVPEDITSAGWWRGGAQIGDPFGAMLIAAHVDSLTQGLGPYAQLLSSRPGQNVTVSSSDLTQKFVLNSRQVISRDSLPQQKSIFSAAGSPRLIMVTCSGPYIKSEGGYQNLAILTAVPTGAVMQQN